LYDGPYALLQGDLVRDPRLCMNRVSPMHVLLHQWATFTGRCLYWTPLMHLLFIGDVP